MIQDSVPDLLCQVQPAAVLLQEFHGAHTLLRMPEAFRPDSVQDPLSGMSEGGMAQVMSEGNGLREILVQAQ